MRRLTDDFAAFDTLPLDLNAFEDPFDVHIHEDAHAYYASAYTPDSPADALSWQFEAGVLTLSFSDEQTQTVDGLSKHSQSQSLISASRVIALGPVDEARIQVQKQPHVLSLILPKAPPPS